MSNRERFRPETRREHLSVLYGLWTAMWTILLLLGGVWLVLELLNMMVGHMVAIVGMILYVFLMFVIMRKKAIKFVFRLASAMVELEIKSREIKSRARRSKKRGGL